MPERSNQPNILFIMADQYRFDYLGCAGADFVRTPNMDALAARGVRFTRCFTNCPVCAPARIGLAAGLQPCRLGSLDNASYLPARVRTYYQRLRDHNYLVGGVGKFDLAKPDPWNGRDGDRPCSFTFGFTHPFEIEGKMHAGQFPQPQGPYGLWLQSRGLYEKFRRDYIRRRDEGGWIKGVSHDSVLPEEAYVETYTGRQAAEWLENADETFPWHLLVSFVGPHDPFDPPSKYAEKYRNATMPLAVPHDPRGRPKEYITRAGYYGLDAEEVAVTRRQYCAIIECIDEQIGRILEVVERRGWGANTYVIFTSDHGEMLGDHGLYTKSVPYEPSLHVPLLVAGPGIEAGRVCDAIVELIDLNPTVCELAGLAAQENIDARSFAAVLRGETVSHREEAVAAIRNWRCIRTERHKLVENYNDVTELYDMIDDPRETRNVAEEQPDVVEKLTGRMRGRFLQGAWRR